MAKNTLRWPEFEQLGREFCDALQPALAQFGPGQELDEEAQRGLRRLEAWLNAPCVATVKLDGTNVGVDNAGLLVGRNVVVEPGANYQKVDVCTLLKDYPGKVELIRSELERAAGGEVIAQAMLYGELVVNGKYNYASAGIFKDWLCFGAILRPGSEDEEAVARLSTQLRASGYNVKACEGRVRVGPNSQFEALLSSQHVRCVSGNYRPDGLTAAEWSAHDGQGTLPCFRSFRQLLVSEWAQRLLLPGNGLPVCEGLVVASEADGTLFKWKHAGEELGKVPDQLAEAVRQLHELSGSQSAKLPEGLTDAFERLLLVATTKPKVSELAEKKPVQGKDQDVEALAAWDSALTKFDTLEEVFERGTQAKVAREKDLIEQVARDLVKDYGAAEKAALQRATKLVKTQVGMRFGAWKQAQSQAEVSGVC